MLKNYFSEGKIQNVTEVIFLVKTYLLFFLYQGF